jgi:RNA polymerase sigma-70 factor (ECF subfamily)
VTQETWLRAVVAWKKAGLPETPLAWLKTVSRNLLVDHYKRTPMISLERLPGEWEKKLMGNGTRPEDVDSLSTVTWGLARLWPGQARLIEAYHFDGLKVREIAAETGLSERAVEGRLRRARANLRRKLEPLVGPEGGSS